ncbi:hypothetical protein PFICI_10316 [Pestalotiopsis fici W106-1]|uniref:Protein kinase domain-containing protein n=1 Tax=Pestalotiopsis fici (strain W106-1 / CGMCC3.15140) TaxID=1229662 RepID=W3WWU6_PESFW|nr:uncharacterized protein PFICI_10316 [Pestalotiopsis fici W106-1]ETS78254.1 hypothetical protein PFICI_10316 [Pestalotiopsis fici W106-1]
MAGDADDFDDIYDGIFLPLPVVDPSQVRQRVAQSMIRRAKFRNSLIGRFRTHLRSNAFKQKVKTEEIRSDVSAYFTTRHRMRYLKTMRSTSSVGGGGASLFAQLNEDGTERRRLVIKYSVDEGRGQNEAEWLENFARVDHIVNLVRLGEPTKNNSGGGSIPKVPGAFPDPGDKEIEETQTWSTNIYLPMMVLEYMAGGDLNDVRQRCREQDVLPPDRFLWALALCLMRACIGMAHHNTMVRGEKEEIPKSTFEHMNIAHGSMDLSQVLVGPLISDDDEHGLIPIFKLCGFGYTTTLDKDLGLDAVAENMRGIGRIIETLASPQSNDLEEDTGLLSLQSWDYSNYYGESVITHVHDDFTDSDIISPTLQWLVAQQMAEDLDNVPNLSHCLKECVDTVDRYARMTYKQTAKNRTEVIKDFVRDVVLNAPVFQPMVKEPQSTGIAERLPGIMESTMMMMQRIRLEDNAFRGPAPP